MAVTVPLHRSGKRHTNAQCSGCLNYKNRGTEECWYCNNT